MTTDYNLRLTLYICSIVPLSSETAIKNSIFLFRALVLSYLRLLGFEAVSHRQFLSVFFALCRTFEVVSDWGCFRLG